jgi:hypothetical protein
LQLFENNNHPVTLQVHGLWETAASVGNPLSGPRNQPQIRESIDEKLHG